MRALTFDLISDSRFNYYPRRDIQEKIEDLQKDITNMDGVYIKTFKPRHISFTNNYQYRAFCQVIKEKGCKYTWNEIMKTINNTYAPVYKYQTTSSNIEEFVEIKEKRKKPEVICSSLVGETKDGLKEYEIGVIINGELHSIIIRQCKEKNKDKWTIESEEIEFNPEQENI